MDSRTEVHSKLGCASSSPELQNAIVAGQAAWPTAVARKAHRRICSHATEPIGRGPCMTASLQLILFLQGVVLGDVSVSNGVLDGDSKKLSEVAERNTDVGKFVEAGSIFGTVKTGSQRA